MTRRELKSHYKSRGKSPERSSLDESLGWGSITDHSKERKLLRKILKAHGFKRAPKEEDSYYQGDREYAYYYDPKNTGDTSIIAYVEPIYNTDDFNNPRISVSINGKYLDLDNTELVFGDDDEESWESLNKILSDLEDEIRGKSPERSSLDESFDSWMKSKLKESKEDLKSSGKSIITEEDEDTCVFCGKSYGEHGNNAQPIEEGRCCDACNAAIVIPARVKEIMSRKNIEAKTETPVIEENLITASGDNVQVIGADVVAVSSTLNDVVGTELPPVITETPIVTEPSEVAPTEEVAEVVDETTPENVVIDTAEVLDEELSDGLVEDENKDEPRKDLSEEVKEAEEILENPAEESIDEEELEEIIEEPVVDDVEDLEDIQPIEDIEDEISMEAEEEINPMEDDIYDFENVVEDVIDEKMEGIIEILSDIALAVGAQPVESGDDIDIVDADEFGAGTNFDSLDDSGEEVDIIEFVDEE